MMSDEVVEQLLALNQDFYDKLAEPFAHSRVQPQPGFYRLLHLLPQPCHRLLDVGCGDGRFGRFLRQHKAVEHYTGVDFSAELLARTRATTEGDFYQRDISRPGCLDGLGQFQASACLAVLQHVPGRRNRRRLLQEMETHLTVDGRLLLATWQFMDSRRQRRKVVDWSQIGLRDGDVEPGDYLLTWQRAGFALRYVCLIDEAETAALAQSADLRIMEQFRSDGKEGNLNLYTVLCRDNVPV